MFEAAKCCVLLLGSSTTGTSVVIVPVSRHLARIQPFQNKDHDQQNFGFNLSGFPLALEAGCLTPLRHAIHIGEKVSSLMDNGIVHAPS